MNNVYKEYNVIIGRDNCSNFVGTVYLGSKMINRIVISDREEFILDISSIIFRKLIDNRRIDIAYYMAYNNISKELARDINKKVIDILYQKVDDFEIKKDAEDFFRHNTLVRILDKEKYLAVINIIDTEIDNCKNNVEYIKKIFVEHGSTSDNCIIDSNIYELLFRSIVIEKINDRSFIIGCDLSDIEDFNIKMGDITICDYIISIIYLTLLERNNDIWYINALLYNPNVFIFDIILNTLKNNLKGGNDER